MQSGLIFPVLCSEKILCRSGLPGKKPFSVRGMGYGVGYGVGDTVPGEVRPLSRHFAIIPHPKLSIDTTLNKFVVNGKTTPSPTKKIIVLTSVDTFTIFVTKETKIETKTKIQTNTIHNGDALTILKQFPDNTFDSIVTDPPYGISFMNKHWDYDVPTVELWREVLRVLKPGGHCLVACGTRTQHRMAVNLEDAGFEIRDLIAYIYGSGFPKSLNIKKQLDKHYGNDRKVSSKSEAKYFLRPLQEANIPQTEYNEKEQGEILQSVLQEQDLYRTMQREEPEKSESFREESCLEGRCNIEATQRELQKCKICKMSERIFKNGKEGWLCYGTPFGYGTSHWQGTPKNRGCSSYRPRTEQQQNRQSNVIPNESSTQEIRRDSCEVEGWGTALKPAMELWTLCRKPLSEKSVAENVLKWGTGGINIDGCRVGTTDESYEKNSNRDNVKSHWGNSKGVASVKANPQGRFPANIIHDGSEEVLRLFPETKSVQSYRGLQHSGRHGGLSDLGGNIKEGTNSLRGHNDSGSASRFFYCAKASKSERNAGLEGKKWLDSIEIILYIDEKKLWKEKIITQEVNVVRQLADMEISLKKVIEESGLRQKKDLGLNILSYGSSILEKCLTDTKYITKTKINSTTILQTLKLLQHYITREYTGVVFLNQMDGINLVENVENLNTLIITISGKMEYPLGANVVAFKVQFIIKEKDATNFHSTVKPVTLMRYLCRLITPKNRTVLDPFMGSGSTGIGAILEGFNFTGIEREKEYCEIAEARIEHYKDKLKLAL